MNIITVENITKTYTTYHRGSGWKESVISLFKREKVTVNAVDDISFTIKKGDICGILGPNGAGKSTTIKMLCGALYPTSGVIDIMGYNPSRDRKHYVQKIGAVFGQKSQLIWDIPPMDSFMMNAAIYDIPEKEYHSRLDEFITIFDIGEVITKPTRVLSLGERMKCEFVMAMLHNPAIVFLDEPTIGLDVIAKAKIREFILEMNKKGTTFILTTHDLEDIEQLAKNIIIINHGKKVFDQDILALRRTVGEKKIVELTLSTPIQEWSKKNVKLIKQTSPLELTLEIDTETTTMGEFVQELSKTVHFTDIAIKELPMDEIITKIYESK